MIKQNLKWMAIGVAVTASSIFIYNKVSNYKLNNSKYNNQQFHQINPEFANYISAFTTGYISSNSSIKIKLSNEFNTSTELNTAIKERLISFSPEIEGTLVWKDAQNIEFKPKTRLTAGQKYKATFHLNNLIEVKKELKEFDFAFEVIKQSVQFNPNELKSYNSNDFNYYNLSGSVGSADYIASNEIEKTLSAKLNNKNLNIKWVHNEKGTSHQFLIDSIERHSSSTGNLILNCDANSLNINYKSEKAYKIPQKNNFELLSVLTGNDEEQFVDCVFSNPINETQSLQGLIDLSANKDVKYIIANNHVLIYPTLTENLTQILTINQGVKDAKGQDISKKSEHSVVFKEIKPAVRFVGNGNILPSTNSLTIPFETVNLKAVDVKIIRIYENNILQFLQSNDLNGGNQLAQVGKKIIEKRINLGISNPENLSSWQKSALDISSLIKPEPGAIYRVTFSFKKAYANYPCLGETSNFEMEEINSIDEQETDYEYFGYYYDEYEYDYYSEEGDGSGWEDRDNPCKDYYYKQYDRKISKNILASDLGVTFKKGNDGSYFVVTTDIVTAKPLNKVKIELYDYQKQLIESNVTNSDGQVFITPKSKPYFLVAKKDNQRAYLRLDEGSVLSLSMYDVSGDQIKKGIKGFIYGERGVWRPGDSLFLNFILEDKTNSLPENHPVVFSLTNPQGQLVKKLVSNKGINGFYNFTCATDKNSPTGFWNAEVKVGSVKFNKLIRIEAIMPNRLKIELHAGDGKLLVNNNTQNVTLHTNWLTGAKAKNLAANINVVLSNNQTSFEKFSNYNFNDVTNRFETQNLTLFDGKVDENGNTSMPLNFEISNAPGFLKANFTTRVYEPGGTFSIDRFSIDYSPFTNYVGIKLPSGESNSGILYTGKSHQISIATVNYLGKATNRSNIKFEMYKLNWHWWWDQYNDDVANFISDEYHKPIQTDIINTSNGIGKVNVNIKENDWGRYLIRVIDTESGHSCSQIVYFDWSNWMERDGGDNKIVNNLLHFTTDKIKYKTNEEAIINIPTPQGGRALITVENGSKVLQAHWLETEKGNSQFKLKITEEMSPNVYIHVSLIQQHSRLNDLPIRLYGVVPINIDNPETHLKPIIKMPEVLMPEKNVSIQISESNNKEMAFTIAMVDEGLLDITRFKTPNPHNVFYAKEALGVKTWDIFDNVIGAFGADLERILSIGGDGSEIGDDGAKANRFKPMVRFFGPYYLKKGENKTINFTMPLYVGSVRTMVIAGNKGAYGFAEKTTPVKAPIMLLGNLPRVLSVTEEIKFPISVFGGDKSIGKTDLKIECNGLVQVVGSNQKSIQLDKDDEKLVWFNLKVKNSTGIAKVKVTANGAGYTTSYEAELDVRNPNPYQTNVKDFYVEANKTIDGNYTATGITGTNKGVLEISTIPPINLDERLHYLISYPHGCIEQTTSQVFAQLYLPEIMDLTSAQKTEIDLNIKAGINEIRKFQTGVGGFSYWQGTADVQDWATSYAGHFLILAEKKGYTLPSGLKSKWLKFMQTTANDFDIQKNNFNRFDELQAYRLYVLALSGNASVGAMNRLREFKTLGNNSKWLLASAYALIGQINEAEKLIASTKKQTGYYTYDYNTFGSSDRDEALILNALCGLNKKQQAFIQVKKVAGFLASKKWLSTQTTAYGLVAISNFINKYGDPSAMQAKVFVNGKDYVTKGNSSINQFNLDLKTMPKGNYKITNNGKGILYARLITRGKPNIGTEIAENNNLTIDVVYKDRAGNNINVLELEQGKDIVMNVTIQNLGMVGDIKNIALMSYIPGGWEIQNTRLDEDDILNASNVFTYQDIKDDKVLTYFDLNAGQSKTFNIGLTAAYEGKFYLPAINVEAMYDNSIFARTKGYWINVVSRTNQSVTSK